MQLKKQERERLRELALAATQGEREWIRDRFHGGWHGLYTADGDAILAPSCCNDGDTGAAWFSDEDGDDIELRQGDREFFAALTPATLLALLDRVDELEWDAEPVAWFHENPLRADAISDYIKSLLVDGESSPGGIHRPMDEGNKYSIPLYRHPPTERAVPEGYMKVTRELMNFLCSVGHHGAVICDEGQPYEIGIDDVEYAQNLFTQLHDAAPGAGGGE